MSEGEKSDPNNILGIENSWIYKGLANTFMHNSHIIINIWTVDGLLADTNDYLLQITGFVREDLIGYGWRNKLINYDICPSIDELFLSFKLNKAPAVHQGNIMCKNGNIINVLWCNNTITNSKGQVEFGVSVGIDITNHIKLQGELKEKYEELEKLYETLKQTQDKLELQLNEHIKDKIALRISEERHRLSLHGSNDGLWDWDAERNTWFFSDRCRSMLGYNDSDLSNDINEWKSIVHPDDLIHILRVLDDYKNHLIPNYSSEIRITSKDGNYRWILARGKGIWDDNGVLTRMAGSITDITELKTAYGKISKLAFYDKLTGLPNNALFTEILSSEMFLAKEKNKKLAVLFMDLDNFKYINDTLGHNVGDDILISVSRKLKESLNNTAIVARRGGDEFIFLLTNVKDKKAVESFMSKMINNFKNPIMVNSFEILLSCSIGATIFPDDGEDIQLIYKNADAALYNSKGSGKRTYSFYTKEMNEKIREKLLLEDSLPKSINNKNFIIHYQPQVEIKSRKLIGLEALIRWNHPTLGMVSPLRFIPIAEETGLIIPLGEWIIYTACLQIKSWIDKGYPPIKMSINLSVRQLASENIVERIKDIILKTGIDPTYIEFEITESGIIKNFDYTINILNRLKELGVSIALDDFGTGYSSLIYLTKFPIDTLKIDKSFVDDIATNSNNQYIAKAIIDLAKNMNLKLIVEGIENEAQLEFFLKNNCDIAQGYLFSKPLPQDEILKILTR